MLNIDWGTIMENIVIFLVAGLLLISGAAALLMFLGYFPIAQSDRCGIEDCHGMNVRCGPNVPDACTEIYMAGDRCRQYATCGYVDGKCSLIAGKEFEDCRSCVEKCLEKNDSMEVFSCESLC